MAYSTDGFHLLFDKESTDSISTVRFSGRLGSAKAYLYQLYEERLLPLLEGEVVVGKTYFIDYRYLGSVFLRIEGANSKTSLTEYIGSESINTVTKEVKALNVFSPKQALVSLLYPYEHADFFVSNSEISEIDLKALLQRSNDDLITDTSILGLELKAVTLYAFGSDTLITDASCLGLLLDKVVVRVDGHTDNFTTNAEVLGLTLKRAAIRAESSDKDIVTDSKIIGIQLI